MVRYHCIERELLVFAIQHNHRRMHIQRITGFLTGARLPALTHDFSQIAQLHIEVLGGFAFQRNVPALQLRLISLTRRVQLRCLEVAHIGNHQHHLRVLGEAVCHLLEPKAHIFHTDFLGRHQERNLRKTVVHCPQHMRQYLCVPHTRIKQTQRRWFRIQPLELFVNTLRNRPLFIGGGDEQQILLAAVKKAQRLSGCRFSSRIIFSIWHSDDYSCCTQSPLTAAQPSTRLD